MEDAAQIALQSKTIYIQIIMSENKKLETYLNTIIKKQTERVGSQNHKTSH